ncbi:hypothetical protein E3V39_12430 [Gammaproteobacteria bacterium LSUCC0112]|nr:hypothetical protein E3V39_12430 [Gammaproteobacteria bacterium LSUCC0112]
MTIDREAHHALVEIVEGKQWDAHKALTALLPTLTVANVEEAPKCTSEGQVDGKERTSDQHRALFLWFGMIEKEAENAGLTWDMIIRHTHQLRITKETLHGMCKSLQKALWKTTSTKELKKHGNIDILIDHFVDVFSKEGLELPPFPFDPKKNNSRLQAMENLANEDYPEYHGAPTI